MPQNERLHYQDGFIMQLCQLSLCIEILNARVCFQGPTVFKTYLCNLGLCLFGSYWKKLNGWKKDAQLIIQKGGWAQVRSTILYSYLFFGGGGRVVKNVLYTLLLWILITLSLFLGCEKTKESWTEYSICPGDWQNPALNPRVSCCYWQTANSLHCRQSWCSTGPSGSTGKLYTGWIWCICVLTGFLNQPKTVWLSLSIILIIGICNMIGMKVQVNFR